VSIREYARQVGRAHKTITAMVNGYAAHRSGGAAAATLNEAIERAKMSNERELATDAVAKVRGISFAFARKTEADTVPEVLHAARDMADQQGIAVEEAAATAVRLAIRPCRRKSPRAAARRGRRGTRGKGSGEVSLSRATRKPHSRVGEPEHARSLPGNQHPCPTYR
jgi:hypothetical protein